MTVRGKGSHAGVKNLELFSNEHWVMGEDHSLKEARHPTFGHVTETVLSLACSDFASAVFVGISNATLKLVPCLDGISKMYFIIP